MKFGIYLVFCYQMVAAQLGPFLSKVEYFLIFVPALYFTNS